MHNYCYKICSLDLITKRKSVIAIKHNAEEAIRIVKEKNESRGKYSFQIFYLIPCGY